MSQSPVNKTNKKSSIHFWSLELSSKLIKTMRSFNLVSISVKNLHLVGSGAYGSVVSAKDTKS